MTKFIPLIFAASSMLYAGYDMAFAKVSKEIKIEKPSSVNIVYTMHDILKKDFEDSMTNSLQDKGICVDDKADIDIEIVPVRFVSMTNMGFKSFDTITPAPLVKWEPLQEVIQTTASPDVNSSASVKKTFLDGISQSGSQGSYSTLAQGIGNMVTVGLINVALGSIANGVDYLWTTSDKYIMISDVVIHGERTRVFAMVKDGSTIEIDEAVEVLARLTTEKIIAILGGNQ